MFGPPSTQVTAARLESDGSDLELTVTVWRFPGIDRVLNGVPLAADVPQDFRDALRKWLDAAEATS